MNDRQRKAMWAKNLKGKLTKDQQIDLIRGEGRITSREAADRNYYYTKDHPVFIPFTFRPWRTQAGLTMEKGMERHKLYSSIGKSGYAKGKDFAGNKGGKEIAF